MFLPEKQLAGLLENYTAGLKENKLHVTKILCVPTDQRVSQKKIN